MFLNSGHSLQTKAANGDDCGTARFIVGKSKKDFDVDVEDLVVSENTCVHLSQ